MLRIEPIEGLPEILPEGERILWQGSPDGLSLAVQAFHIRFVAAYFAVTALWRALTASGEGAIAGLAVLAAGVVVVGILYALASAMARAAIFTITNRRIVFRYGAAIRKYVNLPFSEISGVALKPRGARGGDIAISTTGKRRVPYFHLWPFARPLRFPATTPLMRALPDARAAVDVLAKAMKANAPTAVALAGDTAAAGEKPGPVKQGPVAAPLPSGAVS